MMRYILPLLFCFVSVAAYATHNRAGQISVRQLDGCGLAVEATITTYTKASSTNADRDTLTICWGDGFCEEVARSNGNGNGVVLQDDIKLNTYIATHTYGGRGTYAISTTDPNRNQGILNVNFPNSENIEFHLETSYTFLNPLFQGCNNTPVLENPPVDKGCIGQPYIHNPGAYDEDGDSISYSLTTPQQGVNDPVPNYVFPHLVTGNEGSNIFLNSVTGDFVWDSPSRAGEYNFAIFIISWRNGTPIDTVLRDVQFTIEDCGDNLPPQIQTIDEICVVAGTLVSFPVTATDPDMDDQVRLTAAGGPFIVENFPADNTIWTDRTYGDQPFTKQFVWQTTCEHIADQPYTIVFRAQDNSEDTTGLSFSKTVTIKVVGPAPEDLQAESESNEVTLTWESPYDCEVTVDNSFFGFSVWRREGSNQFPIDTCTPGLAGRGYQLIDPQVLEIEDGRYTFFDQGLDRGRTYCYRVLGNFVRFTTTASPEPYNQVESLPSMEVCIQLSRDVPLITNVSVEETSTSDGEMFLRWTKPKAEDLDTLQNPGPYRYELFRATGINGTDFQALPGAVFEAPEFYLANDTTFTDTELNTQDNAYTYRLDFYANNEFIGSTTGVSSVFLNIASTDETNNLSWDFDVPWDNFEFTVYRFNQQSMLFDSIGRSSEPFYSDQGLVNGREYCYFVEAFGSYGVDDVAAPLINLSQENCGTPLDTIPPCPPQLEVFNICDGATTCVEEELVNELKWINPMNLCEETDDVVGYRIYYTPVEGGDFELIASHDDSQDTTELHMPDLGIAGCYAVTAVDTFNNESAFSNIVCVDNCPNYELPNVFTPNGDGVHEIFQPYPYCFIQSVEVQIFDRWGVLVHETKDPDINWDGTNMDGKPLDDGTYYYVVRVFEQRVSGVSERAEPLAGFVELIRGK